METTRELNWLQEPLKAESCNEFVGHAVAAAVLDVDYYLARTYRSRCSI